MEYNEAAGVWLSLVERCVRDAEVEGSNPFTPTIIAGVLLKNEAPASFLAVKKSFDSFFSP